MYRVGINKTKGRSDDERPFSVVGRDMNVPIISLPCVRGGGPPKVVEGLSMCVIHILPSAHP